MKNSNILNAPRNFLLAQIVKKESLIRGKNNQL